MSNFTKAVIGTALILSASIVYFTPKASAGESKRRPITEAEYKSFKKLADRYHHFSEMHKRASADCLYSQIRGFSPDSCLFKSEVSAAMDELMKDINVLRKEYQLN